MVVGSFSEVEIPMWKGAADWPGWAWWGQLQLWPFPGVASAKTNKDLAIVWARKNTAWVKSLSDSGRSCDREGSAEKKRTATQEDTSSSVAPLRRQQCWDHLWWLVILKLWKYSCSFPTRKQNPERLRSSWVVIPISVWCCPATEDGGRIWMSLGSEMTSQDKWALHSKVKSLKLSVGLTSMDWIISEQSSLLAKLFSWLLP